MTTLLQRSLVLTFSRFANQAIVLVSPMLLVRLLTVDQYGMYREFLLYAAFVVPLVVFGVKQGLSYFLPKYPEQEAVWVTQTVLCMAASSAVAVVIMALAVDLIRARASFDFVLLLQLYTVFFVNLDFLETYWIGKKRTDFVLYTSTTRLTLRMLVVVVTAAIARDAQSIIVSLVAFEILRFLTVFIFAIRKRWFTSNISWDSLRQQLSYTLPLGAGGVLEIFNKSCGTLMISMSMGPQALAYFATGAFATEIVNVLRGAIADVVFPEIVAMHHATARHALPLWRRATTWYCVLLFPMAVLLGYYADAVITVLFTDDYRAAVPIFAAFSVLLYLACFDFHLPLRVQNANRFFLVGSGIALVVNLALLYPLYLVFGILGPVFALILSRAFFTVYLGHKVMRLYEVGLGEMLDWRNIGKVLMASLVCFPILVLGRLVFDSFLVRGAVAGVAYLLAYFALLKILGVWDAFAVARRLLVSSRRA